jgi:hypothetical protein
MIPPPTSANNSAETVFQTVNCNLYSGLRHDFLLLDQRETPFSEGIRRIHDPVSLWIHEDLFLYMWDFWKLVPAFHLQGTRKSPKLVSLTGLDANGIAIIRGKGAAMMARGCRAWAAVFEAGPERQYLTGGWQSVVGNPEVAGYQRLFVRRSHIVPKLKTLAEWAELAAASRGRHYLVHFGV